MTPWGSEAAIRHTPPKKILWPPIGGLGALLISPSNLMGDSEFVKNSGVPRYINPVAACGILGLLSVTLDTPQQKRYMMVKTNLPDLGHVKKTKTLILWPLLTITTFMAERQTDIRTWRLYDS